MRISVSEKFKKTGSCQVCVKNINGTGKKHYAESRSKTGTSWLDTWQEQIQGQDKQAVPCAVIGCVKNGRVGAHVLEVAAKDQLAQRRISRSWKLIPMCDVHNSSKNKAHMYLKSDSKLAYVAKKKQKKQ